jgi:hypothetical protein
MTESKNELGTIAGRTAPDDGIYLRRCELGTVTKKWYHRLAFPSPTERNRVPRLAFSTASRPFAWASCYHIISPCTLFPEEVRPCPGS